VHKAGGRDIQLTWSASCHTADDDYEIYEGTIGDFTSHSPLLCTTGGERQQVLTPSAFNAYYLVVASSGEREGSYGADSSGAERPQSSAACLDQFLAGSCP